MEMVDQQTQQQISDLVNACRGYWELRGIPQDRRNEMRLEFLALALPPCYMTTRSATASP